MVHQCSLTAPLAAGLPEALASEYDLQEVLGCGSYAFVYKIFHRATGESFALKVVDKAPLQARALLPQLEREIRHLTEFAGTPHVVNMHEAIEVAGTLFMRFQLCDQSLEQLVDNEGPLDEEAAFHWISHACLGMRELHAVGLVHRDLKPSNMLVDAEGSLRICDFGWACLESDGLSGFCGTQQYAPPEMLQRCGPPHTTKADIYSIGACLQHMLLGRLPESSSAFPANATRIAIELREELMEHDPEARPDAEDLLHRDELRPLGQLSQLWRRASRVLWSQLGGESSPATATQHIRSHVPGAHIPGSHVFGSHVPGGSRGSGNSGTSCPVVTAGKRIGPPFPMFNASSFGLWPNTSLLAAPTPLRRFELNRNSCGRTPTFSPSGFVVGLQMAR